MEPDIDVDLPSLAELPRPPMMEPAAFVPRAVARKAPKRPAEAKVLMVAVLLVLVLGFLIGTMTTTDATLPAAVVAGLLLLVLIWSALPVLLRRSR